MLPGSPVVSQAPPGPASCRPTALISINSRSSSQVAVQLMRQLWVTGKFSGLEKEKKTKNNNRDLEPDLHPVDTFDVEQTESPVSAEKYQETVRYSLKRLNFHGKKTNKKNHLPT